MKQLRGVQEMAVDPTITWPVAFTIIAGIAVAAVTIAGFITQSFKRETPWKDPVSKLHTAVGKLETQLSEVSTRIDNTQQTMKEQGVRNEKDFDRILERIEKVTDLMIDMIRDETGEGSNKS